MMFAFNSTSPGINIPATFFFFRGFTGEIGPSLEMGDTAVA